MSEFLSIVEVVTLGVVWFIALLTSLIYIMSAERWWQTLISIVTFFTLLILGLSTVIYMLIQWGERV